MDLYIALYHIDIPAKALRYDTCYTKDHTALSATQHEAYFPLLPNRRTSLIGWSSEVELAWTYSTQLEHTAATCSRLTLQGLYQTCDVCGTNLVLHQIDHIALCFIGVPNCPVFPGISYFFRLLLSRVPAFGKSRFSYDRLSFHSHSL